MSDSVGSALQSVLVDLIDISLQGKQAHWNIQGPRFRSLHLQLDEIDDFARTASDEVPERMAAIGVAPDGRASQVNSTSGIGDISASWIKVSDGYEIIESKLQTASDNIKKNLESVDPADPLSGDLLIGIATELEKQAWMLRAASVAE